MPEDALVFDFKATLKSEAEQRLADDIFTLQTMTRKVEDTSKEPMTAEPLDTADWDGNVPPDFCDEFTFLL